MEKREIFLSLFDFLSRPAGTDLGKSVFETATKQKQPIKYRDVTTKKYQGKVCLYEVEFLKQYFDEKA